MITQKLGREIGVQELYRLEYVISTIRIVENE